MFENLILPSRLSVFFKIKKVICFYVSFLRNKVRKRNQRGNKETNKEIKMAFLRRLSVDILKLNKFSCEQVAFYHENVGNIDLVDLLVDL